MRPQRALIGRIVAIALLGVYAGVVGRLVSAAFAYPLIGIADEIVESFAGDRLAEGSFSRDLQLETLGSLEGGDIRVADVAHTREREIAQRVPRRHRIHGRILPSPQAVASNDFDLRTAARRAVKPHVWVDLDQPRLRLEPSR